MKKIILLGVGFLTLTTIGCQKETQTPLNASPQSLQVKTKQSNGISSERRRQDPDAKWLLTDGNGNYYCDGQDGNCYDLEVFGTESTNRMKNVIAVVGSNNPIAIKNVFSHNRSTLSTYLIEEEIDNVIAGTWKVESSFSTITNSTFLIFKENNGKEDVVVLAMPVTFK
jgi:hypothetical protein